VTEPHAEVTGVLEAAGEAAELRRGKGGLLSVGARSSRESVTEEREQRSRRRAGTQVQASRRHSAGTGAQVQGWSAR
jgi:hypothetical protein